MDLVKSEVSVVNWSDKQTLAVIKATVAQGLTDPEFAMFARFSQSTGLNPFKKEVWAIKAGGRVQIMTGINGYHTIANNHPQYDGIESGLVGKDGQELPLTYPGNDFVGAWCRVHRKDRKIPASGVAFLSEYDKGIGNWKTMRRVMITKCAKSIALREAFPQELNGTYTAEEMPVEFSQPKETVVTPPKKPQGLQEVREILLGDSEPTNYSEVLDADPGPQIDWSALPHRYHIPVKKDGKDMNAVRTALKAKGFKFNPEDKHWYGPGLVPKLAEYYRPLNPVQAELTVDSDDIPYEAWDEKELHEDAGRE